MKNLEAARDLLWDIIGDWEDFFEKHQNDEDFDTEKEKDDIETLHFLLDVVVAEIMEERKKEGDRLDKLLDKLEDKLRTLHGAACVCVTLSTMEEHFTHMGEWYAAGRCNEIQHKYLG